MRVLFVTPTQLDPADSGGKLVSRGLVEGLRRRGHRVDVHALPRGRAVLQESSAAKPRLRHTLRHLATWAAHPYPVAKYWSDETYRRLRAVVLAGSHDIVHCDHLHAAEYGLRLIREMGVPCVLLQHNAEHVLWKGAARVGWNVPRRLFCAWEASRIYDYEHRVVEAFDACIALTEDDANALRPPGSRGRVVTLRPGWNRQASELPSGDGEDAVVVFVGRTDWFPNLDGMVWFVRHVWPKVLERQPRTRLRIVGGYPPRAVRRLNRCPGVDVVGWVEDPLQSLMRGQVVIAPLRIGSGIRIKILQALAAGRPVVSTPVGCAGLGLREEVEILIGRDEESLALQTVRLLREPKLRQRIAVAGLAFMQRWPTEDRAAARLESVYEECVGRRAGLRDEAPRWRYAP